MANQRLKQANQELLDIVSSGQKYIKDAQSMTRSYTKDLADVAMSKPIKIVTGFRRAGKSTIVRASCQKLISRKQYALKNILYLNFEDLQLAKYCQANKVKEIIDFFLAQNQDKKLLVFDEIQLVKNWDKLLRTIYEFEDLANIIITGSNSELLSSELGSNLAGRFIELSIQPFSFKEFLQYKNIIIKNKPEFERHEDEITDYFYEYVRFGGFPEIFSITTDDAKRSYLEGLVSKVILSDVVERFNIRNASVIEKILIYILINIGNVISFVKIETYLKQLDYALKQGTIINYVDYLQRTFAIAELARFSWKSQRVFDSSKKYYAIDVALSYLYHDLGSNFSKRLENLVYLKLKRDKRFNSIYYGYDESEIDFISLDRKTNLFAKYQVTKELNDDNQERELDPLIYSDRYTKHSENYLLCLNADNLILSSDTLGASVRIKQNNLLRWLLDIA
jgi:predicted AAA+ superfamily ATPase